MNRALTASDIRERLYETVFPAAHPAVVTGDVDRSVALQVMSEVQQQRYPAALHAFGYGSALNGAYRRYSDLDVLVVLPGGGGLEVTWTMHRGYPVDVKSIGIETLRLQLAKPHRDGVEAPFLISVLEAVCYGEVLRGEDESLLTIRRQCRALVQNGPAVAQRAQADRLRAVLTSGLIDFLTVDDGVEASACAIAMANALVAAKFVCAGCWFGAGKLGPRQLSAIDPSFFPRLQQSYISALSQDKAPLASLVLDILGTLGGPAWDGVKLELHIPRATGRTR